MKTILLCKICGDKRDRGQLKCKYCQIKAIKKKQREQVKKEKKKIKRENNPTRLKKECDKKWRSEVIEWYGNKCVVCGSEKINVHHCVSRANRSTRWYIPNGVPLCALHHTFGNQSAHTHPLWFREVIVGLRGIKWEKDLIAKSNEIWDKTYRVI